MMEKCDECGTALISPCFDCGAPVCCPLCCAKDKIQRLESELESVKHERDKLKTELHETVGQDDLLIADLKSQLCGAMEENAELRREVSELNRALIAMAKYSDWALVVSDDEEQLISTLLERAEKGGR